MEHSFFKVGLNYEAKKKDFLAPSEVSDKAIPGKTLCFTVLEPLGPANYKKHMDGDDVTEATFALWRNFLHVKNHKTGKAHLLHPDTLEKAVEI